MLDANYFREQLPRDVQAAGQRAIVEIRLRGGPVHRVRAVVAVNDGYVTFERYQQRGEDALWEGEGWKGEVLGGEARATDRVVLPYESVLDVIVMPGATVGGSPIGFSRA